MMAGDYKKAHSLLPTTFKEVFEQPKVFEQILAIGQKSVQMQIEFELIQLSQLVSVGGNITDAQVPFIARNLIEMYPKESIADFRLCFERGAMGRYGSIQRLDGVTIGLWMSGDGEGSLCYLDEKYSNHEAILHKEKKTEKAVDLNDIVTDDEKVNGYLEQMKANAKEAKIQNVMSLTDKEIRKFGKEKPVVGTPWKPMTMNEIEAHDLHNQWIRENHDLYTGHKKETWISEEEFLKQHGKI